MPCRRRQRLGSLNSVGRFSDVHHWPVLPVRRGRRQEEALARARAAGRVQSFTARVDTPENNAFVLSMMQSGNRDWELIPKSRRKYASAEGFAAWAPEVKKRQKHTADARNVRAQVRRDEDAVLRAQVQRIQRLEGLGATAITLRLRAEDPDGKVKGIKIDRHRVARLLKAPVTAR